MKSGEECGNRQDGIITIIVVVIVISAMYPYRISSLLSQGFLFGFPNPIATTYPPAGFKSDCRVPLSYFNLFAFYWLQFLSLQFTFYSQGV